MKKKERKREKRVENNLFKYNVYKAEKGEGKKSGKEGNKGKCRGGCVGENEMIWK